MSFVYIRQGLAMGIVWYALVFIDKKYIRFFMLIITSFFIHKTAILFAPVYFISKLKIRSITIAYSVAIALLISTTALSSFFFGFLDDSANNEKFSKYLATTSTVNFFYLFEILLLIVLIFKFKNKFYTSDKGTLILNGMLGYAFISILSLTNATFVRFTWYYLIFILLGLPYIYQFIAVRSQKRQFKFAVYLYYSLLFFRLLILYDDGDFLPYKSIFNDFDRHGRWEFMEYR